MPRQPLLAAMQLRAITESIRDYAVFLLDPGGIILSWNSGAERIKGYKAQEIVGQSFATFYTPEDRARGRPQAFLLEAAREGRAENEGWRVRKDGTRFWADAILSAIHDDDGSLQGFVKVTRDLTERRRAEQELRQSEARMRLMLASVRDYAIFMLDPQGRVATWNAGAEALKGYSAAEIIGEPVSRFYLPEEARSGKAERELSAATTTGRFEEEGWRVRKDGSRFWASVVLTAVRDADGDLVGFAKVTRDISERKRAEVELAAHARQQWALSTLGVYALRTPELKLVMQQAVRTAVETLGIAEIHVVRDDGGPPGPISVPIHAAEGQGVYGWLTVPGEARTLGEGEQSFLQATANVIATALARARVKEQLRTAERDAAAERAKAEQAQEALRERDEFISVAAHELRTPLTALQLKLQGLERISGALGQKSERLDGALRQTQRLVKLVDRLLDVSRVAHGRLEMSPEEFDLAPVVRQVVEDFRDPALQAHSAIELDLPESARGSWDRPRLEQVLVNVLSNAVKYGAGKPISVRLEVDPGSIRLSVADRGIGIAAPDANRVFERFQRAAPIRHYSGMGLGLFITRHIVEAHGGTISVSSAPGQGATFVIALPRFAIPATTGQVGA